MIPVTRPAAPVKIQRKSIRNWLSGTVAAYSDGRTPQDGLRRSNNVYLQEDGAVGPRPSQVLYGAQPPGTVLGELFEFKNVVGSVQENWLVAMCNVSGTTKPYISKNGGAWARVDGKSYNNTARAHFVQVDNKVLILNGADTLSFLNIPTSSVTGFISLSTPAAPSLSTNTGLVGSNFTIYYRISANSTVGETISSSQLAVPVLTDRDMWNPATQSLLITWGPVTSAVSYNVYMGTVSGFEYLIAQGVNGTSFTDNGTTQQDITRRFTTTDSTTGPICTRGTVINGQVFLFGDTTNPYLIRYGGTGASVLDFSPSNGGGYSEIGRGGKEIPVQVKPFRDGRGNPQISVLCKGSSGSGKRFLLVPDSITIGDTTATFFDVVEDNGRDGTNAADAVILYNDSLYYPSGDGFKTTGTKPQLQNILSTNRITNTIENDVRNISSTSIDKACGVGFEGRLYFALPVASSTNNQIWVLDLERKGAWMEPWSISADWMTLYEDSDGFTHFLVLSNNKIFELTKNTFTTDNGIAFPTSGDSGVIKFSDDGQEWVKLIRVIFVVLNAQGTTNFSVSGQTEDGVIPLGSETLISSSGSNIAGWGEASWGTYGWSRFPLVPTTVTATTEEVSIDVDEDVKYITYSWNSQVGGTDYLLSDVIAEYVPIGIKEP